MGNAPLPADPRERHGLLVRLREEAYEQLCNEVYTAKGYTLNGIPLRETVEKFGLMDEKADTLLKAFDLRQEQLSN
jgi:hypothetical protein